MKQLKLVRAIGLAAGMAAAVGISPAAQAGEEGFGPYATDSTAGTIRTGTGGCWKVSGGDRTAREECGDGSMAEPAVEVPAPIVTAPRPEADDDRDGVPNRRDVCRDTRPGAKVDGRGCEIVESRVFNLVNDEFAFNSAMLKPEMLRELDGFARQVLASPGNETLKVVGHTDNVGSDEYNQKLSVRRAQAVADYLARKGVPVRDMKVSGKGESDPLTSNKNETGRARNRRVEIIAR